MARPKLYNTKAKRIATVKQSGKIITFKTPAGFPETYVNQILAKGLEKRKGAVKILGVHRDSNWYNSMDELLDDIEWEKMEDWHGGDDNYDKLYEPSTAYYTETPEIVLGNIAEITIPEIKVQYHRGKDSKLMSRISSSKDAEKILRQIFPEGELDLQEQFIILYLNPQNKLLGYYRHTKGSLVATLADIRLIISVGVKTSCGGIIISHNHPSGNLKPSQDDIALTNKLKEAARLFDIKVLDHLILSSEDYYSFADEGALSGLENVPSNNFSLLPINHRQFLIQVLRRIEMESIGNKTVLEKLGASFKIYDKNTVKELTELAIVITARSIAQTKQLSIVERYKKIVRLYETQVNLSHRTSQSILLQQYSTPAPIGFLAGIFCGVDKFEEQKDKIAFEPSAGNGLLTIAGNPYYFRVNEIDTTRNLHLQTQGFRSVDKEDATKSFSIEREVNWNRKFDAVITNPPFGRLNKTIEFDNFSIDTLDHLMAIRALELMKDDGKAAIIIGGHTKYDEKGRVQKGANRIFLNYLYSHFNVMDVIPINGSKLYSRQGTSFNTRLILINGRKEKINGVAPISSTTRLKKYVYDGNEYTEKELIEFASSASEYDRRDAGEDVLPIATIEEAIKWLDDVEVISSEVGLEKPVSRFDELYDRVIDAMKTPLPFEFAETIASAKENSETQTAFKNFTGLKPKYKDALLLIRIGDHYYSFNEDTFPIQRAIGLQVHQFQSKGEAQVYIKFPAAELDTYLNKLVKAGNRVGVAEILEVAKDKKAKTEASYDTDLEDLANELERELKKLNNNEEDLGAPYLPASESCVVLNTVVPDSMEYETSQALKFIQQEVGGDIDEFVRQRLGYSSKLDLCKSLSAEQTDAVAMAIYNIEAREQGMIIGDQTGIGKGRIAAAMIRYAVLKGNKPIFITEKPNLFSDIYRDLSAIGSSHLVPFIVNGRESKTDIKDENGEVIHHALSAAEQQVYFKDQRIPANADFVLATYTQFNSPDRKPEKPNFLRAIAEGNIMILDESHNASGSSQTGEYLQGIVSSAKGVIFLSATFAKRPDNMPIYAMKTAIRDANMNRDELVEAISQGGVALQEVLASQLVKEGQMLRRERSFEGVEVNYLTLDELENEHKAIADNITEILRDIISFQSTNVDSLVDEMDDIAVAEGKEITKRGGTSQAGVDNMPYFSKVFQVINQMLFSIKAEAVADRTIMRLKEGKKPVIAFASTMGSFIEQMENEAGLPVANGDTINADFSEVLQRGLDGILRYTVTTPEGKKEFKKFDLSEFAPEVRDKFLAISKKIKQMSSGISISPIDIIVQKLKNAGYNVAEVTGRKYEVQINTKTNKGVVLGRTRINTNDAFRQFNNNEIDVLLINQSGATGASAHAIVTKKIKAQDVKQRVMIVLQAELDINTEVQKRGRINRTGQILPPTYDYVMSAIPAEKRLMMMLQKKLKSLDANTTSNQKQSTKILDVPDFLNKYGDKVVTQYLQDNPEINKLLNDPLKLEEADNEDGEVLEEAAHKVSGRVAVLSTKMQAEFYTEISQNYIDYVEYLRQIGEYDLEVEAMNLEAEMISQKVVRMGKGGDSEFGTDSFLEKVEANILRKPFTKTELENIIKESLSNELKLNPKELQQHIIKEADQFFKTQLEKDLKDNEAYYEELIKDIPNEKKGIKILEKEGRGAYLIYEKERTKELNGASLKQSEKLAMQSRNRLQYLNSIFKFFYVGRNTLYPISSYSEGDTKIASVFLGFIIDKKKKNPYAPSNIRLRFALASSNKYIAIPASYTQDVNAIIGASHDVEELSTSELLTNWEQAIKASSKSRGVRYIVTGNLLQAFAGFNGKLVSYTTNNGETKKGILMPEYWEADENGMENKVAVPIARAEKVIKGLVTSKGITTENGTSIFSTGDTFKIIVPSSKQRGGDVFLDSDILKLVIGNNFNKTADKMVANIEDENLKDLLNILQAKFNDSLLVDMAQFKSIQKEDNPARKDRNPIVLLSQKEVEEQEELALLAMAVEVELELELELMRLAA